MTSILNTFKTGSDNTIPALEARLERARAAADTAWAALGDAHLDDGDGKRAAQARKDFDAATQLATDLESALDRARARLADQAVEAGTKADAARAKARDDGLVAINDGVMRVDAAMDALAAATTDLRGRFDAVQPHVDWGSYSDALGKIQRALPHCLSYRLRDFSQMDRSPFLDEPRRKLTFYAPTAATLLVRKGKS